MKNFFLLLISLLFIRTTSTNAQVNQWVWLHGSNTSGSLGTYGTQGIPNPTNVPPAVYEGSQWTDLNGNFWLYAGILQSFNFSNDLWMYNPITNQWTWMKGTNTPSDPGVFGTQGISSPANRPPGLGYGCATWTDLNNNLWLFGGTNAGNMADLWKYNIATNEWTWVKGPGTVNSLGVFGTQGVPDPANFPPSRSETAAAWTDLNGDLWLFGGTGYVGSMNDLWRYNIATNTWTWIKGSNLGFQFGKYGTKGIEKSTNTPGGRMVYSHWLSNDGNLWLFAGDDGTGGSSFNDVWRYNVLTNNWTWMGGTNYISGPGNRGTQCVPGPATVPSPRFENRACWKDAKGDFWTFGGGRTLHFDSTWNEIWKYCVLQNQWVFIAGDTVVNPIGNWGIKGVSSPTNKPDGRGGAPAWADQNGRFYIFGGSSSIFPKMYNDLWRYTVDSTCGVCGVLPVAHFYSSDTAFCNEGGECIDFFDLSTNNPTSWSWHFPGATPDTSTMQNPTGICYYLPGTYDVTLVATNLNGSDSLKVSSHIIFGSGAALPTITLKGGDTLYCSHAAAYQWYFNGTPIPGATDSFYVATQNGDYNVYITDDIGCSRLGNPITVTLINVNDIAGAYHLEVFPNPVKQSLTISHVPLGINGMINIYNVVGETVYSQQYTSQSPQFEINVSALSQGLYFIRINDEAKNYVGRFVKE